MAEKNRPSKVLIERQDRILDDFFKVDEAVLRYERYDGQLSEPVRRLTLERGDSVAVVVFDVRAREILLVEQFKYPIHGHDDGWIMETVAGMVDADDPEDAARREVREEIGYDLLELRHIATFYVSPGGTSERVLLYYGEVDDHSRVGAGGGLAAEGEDIALRRLTLDDAWRALDAGEINDAKTLIGLMWLRNQAGPSPNV